MRSSTVIILVHWYRQGKNDALGSMQMLVIKHAIRLIVEDGLVKTLWRENDSRRTGVNQQVVSQKEGENEPPLQLTITRMPL